jgi:hypothetical protein
MISGLAMPWQKRRKRFSKACASQKLHTHREDGTYDEQFDAYLGTDDCNFIGHVHVLTSLNARWLFALKIMIV